MLWLSKHAFDSSRASGYLGKRPACSVLVPSLGQLLGGKSGCACGFLAGTCWVGMANKGSGCK